MASLQSLGQMDVSEIAGIVRGGEVVYDPTAIARRKLVSLLRKLHIRPFEQAGVDAFKASKVKPTAIIANICILLFCATIPVYLIGAMVRTKLSAVWAEANGIPFGLSWVAAGHFFVGLAVAAALMWVFNQLYIRYHGSKWDYTELNLFQQQLKRPVPAEVQQLAARLRKASPEIGLKVEYFKLDPFLVVYDYRNPGAFYTVAVWDETGYRIAYD